jgi:hypothetical protein
MLWNLTVSYGELNASDLLKEKGYYLVFKVSYSAEGDADEKWYAFDNAFYLDEEDGYNSMGYLSSLVYSVQFAVVAVAPTDSVLGAYDSLTESDFVSLSEVYYNEYFAA